MSPNPINLLENDTFSFFVPVEPIEKSNGAKDKRRWIQGIASTDGKDLQGETVHQPGIDLSYFLAHGYINDDHKPGPENKVGEPTEARITKAGLWIKAFLYKGHERAEHWWSFINSLEQSDANRKVGFSIQGKVLRREGNRIMKCWLQDVAITASPVNTSTWAEIAKALCTQQWCKHPWKSLEKACAGCPGRQNCKPDIGPPGVPFEKEDEEKALSAGGMGGILTPESLEGSAKVQTYKSMSRAEAVEYLMLVKGYRPHTAEIITDTIFARNGLVATGEQK